MDSTGERKENARAQADAWFTPVRLVLFLSLIIFVRYPRVVMGLDSFFYRDYGLFTYPIAHHIRECFWRGELPLWNPLNNCGMPFLAQWNSSVLYPPSLFYLILPLPWSLAMFNLLHLLFAGMGMYFLSFRWTKSRLAGAVAGTAFAFNGLSFHMLMWVSTLAAYAWMPWVVLFSIRSLEFKIQSQRKGEVVRAIVIAGVAGAMQMLSGGVEVIFLTWFFLGVWWIVQFGRGTIPRTQLFRRMAAVCALVAGLSAAQLLPFLELLSHSQRDAHFGGSQWALPGSGWANFFVPLFHLTPSIIGVYSQDAQQWTTSYYAGVGIVALAILALWCRRRIVWLLGVIAIAGVILAMGDNTPVFGWIRKVFPLIGVMRYPVKIVALTAFALPLLAGFAISVENVGEDTRRVSRKFIGIGIFLVLVIGGILMYAHAHPVLNERWATTCESGLTRAVILALILGAAWTIQCARSARLVGMAGLGMLLLATADALTHMPDQNPTLPNLVYQPLEMQGFGTVRAGESRAALDRKLEAFLNNASIPDRAAYFVTLRRALFIDCNLIDDVPMTGGFFPLDLRQFVELQPLFRDASGPFADFLGVSRISSADISFTWRNQTNFMSLVTCGQKPVFAGKEETLKDMALPVFDPRAVVFLPESARDSINITNQSRGVVTMRHFSSHRIECELQADAPLMVVVSQVFYAPWHAYVDGQRIPILEANGAFQAFAAPAGKHEVRLVYEDAAFNIGAIISLTTLLAAALGWVFGNRLCK